MAPQCGAARGGPSPRGRGLRLFVALWPGEDERATIALRAQQLEQVLHPGGRLVHPGRYHLTLQFLGDFGGRPRRLAGQVLAAMAGIHAPTFQLDLDLAGSFPNRAIPWWLGCTRRPAGLDTLLEALAGGLAREGVQVCSREPLHPHVTIVRDAACTLPATSIDPVCWQVDRVVLVHSVLGKHPEYRLLGSRSLAPS